MTPTLLTYAQAADMLGASVATARRLVRRGASNEVLGLSARNHGES